MTRHMITMRISSIIMAIYLAITPLNAQVSQADADLILSMHNTARASVSPPASNMQAMVWDESLADSAQAYASTCPSGHSNTPGLGENLSWGWPAISATMAVAIWRDEAVYYNYATNACVSGQQCGHYTQMVWASTTRLGCGKQTCADLMESGIGDTWVCHYWPPGNYAGERPYQLQSGGIGPVPQPTQGIDPPPLLPDMPPQFPDNVTPTQVPDDVTSGQLPAIPRVGVVPVVIVTVPNGVSLGPAVLEVIRRIKGRHGHHHHHH